MIRGMRPLPLFLLDDRIHLAAAFTDEDDDVAVSATLVHPAAVAITDEDDTVAAAATLVHLAAVAIVDEDDTVAVASKLVHPFTAAFVDEDDTAAGVAAPRALGPSARILCRITWPNAVVSRLYDGSGPFVTEDGEIWKGVTLLQGGLDALELAMNGEASTLEISLTGVASEDADAVWLSYTNDEIIGATMVFLIQACDTDEQPYGDPEVRFTGEIDNILFDDRVVTEGAATRQQSTITVEVTNRFTLRRLTSGSVLSDVDQQARAALLNPDGDPDLFCERVPALADHTITWPRWN